uniref:Uncharacterized protein n=1 Tax=Globodera pallida TaxID=36090 RepID=A0A183CA77_GLOPA
MTKSAHLTMRASRKGQSHPRRQRPYQGTGQGVELRRPLTSAPLIQAFPEPLEVNSRPATVGVCSRLSFHQQLNRQWAIAEHAAQPDQLEIVNDRVEQQLEDIPEEDGEKF